jgi:hypothetical protein
MALFAFSAGGRPLSSQERKPASSAAKLKFRGAAGDDPCMTRVLMAAVLLAIPLVTSWILARRVAIPVKSRSSRN